MVLLRRPKRLKREILAASPARPTVIFDFDGTIADSFDYVFDYLCSQAGIKPEDAPDKRGFRGMSMKNIAQKLGVPYWRLVYVYFHGRQVMRSHIMHVEPFEGMVEVIKRLKAEGCELFIVSANSGKNIKWFLKDKGLKHVFTAVRGNAGLFGKVSLVNMLLAQYKIKKESCWYVGDGVGDVAAAKAIGVKSAAVTWGFAKAGYLADLQPDILAHTPADLLNVLEKK